MLPDLNLQRFDGIALRVKGDGQTYKFNLKTADQMNVPESTYQAQFDTIQGEWTTVYMPWHEFVPVTRAQYDRKAKPLDPAQVKQLGLVLSRFHYNSLPNQRHKAGTFELQVGCACVPICAVLLMHNMCCAVDKQCMSIAVDTHYVLCFGRIPWAVLNKHCMRSDVEEHLFAVPSTQIMRFAHELCFCRTPCAQWLFM